VRPVRHRSSFRTLALTAVSVAVTGGLLTVSAPAASADIVAQIRDEHGRLDALNSQAEAAAERYNAGRIALVRSQAVASRAEQRLSRDQAALDQIKIQVSAFVAQAYRSGGPDQFVQLITTSTPQTFLDEAAALNQIAAGQAGAMQKLATARHRQEQAKAEATAAVEAAASTLQGIERDKAQVLAAANTVQAILHDLQVKQAQLIKAAKDAAARRVAQAQADSLKAQARATALAIAAFAAAQSAVTVPTPPQATPVSTTNPVAPPVAPVAPVNTTNPVAPPVPPVPPVAPVAPVAPVVTVSPPEQHYAGKAAQIAVQVAQAQLGKPYVWGAAGPDSFDCSGLTMFAYAQAGISLPHYTGAQWNQGRHVSQSELQPGDLIFFGQDLGHVGMYLGNGNFIHAPHTGDVVKISALSGYYQSEYAGAIRLVG
jgi:cell wall-associated NlpC family hydrolase